MTILSALAWGQCACWGGQSLAVQVGNNIESKLSGRLKIYRATLFQGATEQIRIEAAIELLLSEEKQARQILLEALAHDENTAARAAVCKALSRSRSWHRSIRNKNDFIDPLLAILRSKSKDEAKLAASGLLIFEYRRIAAYLNEMITDADVAYAARLNAIYALQLRPEREPMFELIKLRDHSDPAIAATAEKELQESLGIPVGTDQRTWQQILKELQRKNRYEFIRDRLVRQEAKVQKLKAELQRWQILYSSALEKIYESLADEAARTEFLLEHLGSEQSKVRLWSLEKVRQWRLSGPVPAEVFAPSLLTLIADTEAEVRLKTAKLLALMSNLNSAEQLLKQLKAEQNDEVRIQMLGALGEACYYAFLPNSGIRISERIREETLQLAAEYLSGPQVTKVRKGALVLNKLLRHDGLQKNEAAKYLALLAERYKKEKAEPEGSLRGELLNVMAGFCGDGTYRAEAARLFEPVFLDALDDRMSLVREAAVAGLINIDKSKALVVLTDTERDLVNDESVTVRNMLADLAGSVGGEGELVWLYDRLGVNGQNERAWQAMREIFKRAEAAVVCEWTKKFLAAADDGPRPSTEQMIYLLQMAEQKALAISDSGTVRDVRTKLAGLYCETDQFDRAAKYLGMLLDSVENDADRGEILAALVEVDLKAGRFAAAAQLVANRLLERDLGPDDAIVQKIARFLADSAGTADGKAVLEGLAGIDSGPNKPLWGEQLKYWQKQFGDHEQAEPNKVGD